MRLSATERIIREAEEQDASVASLRNRDRGVVTPVSAARDSSGPDKSQPILDADIDWIDEGDEDEGETLVDAGRAAAALLEMRSYGAARPSPRSDTAAAPSLNLSPQHGPAAFGSTQKPPALAVLDSTPSRITLRWAGGVPPGRPIDWKPSRTAPALAEDHRGLVAPLATEATFDLRRPRQTVGRRSGILIAAGTAVAVALAVGAWTTGSEHPVSADVRNESPAGKGERTPAALTAVIVPTVPEAPSVPPASSLPEPAAPTPSAPPSTTHVDSLDPASSAAATPRPRHTWVPTSKSRPARKLTPNRIARTVPPSRKAGASRARLKRAVEVAGPPAARAHNSIRIGADPDATLPITD